MGKKMTTQTGKTDVLLKSFWRDNARFADLFNATIFEGDQVLQPEMLTEADTDVSETVQTGNGNYISLVRNRDVVKKTAMGIGFAIVAIENQMKIHYGAPLRTMLYDGLGYQKEYDEIRKRRKEERLSTTPSSDEFLSGIRKEDRLHPIITIVISYSEDIWDGPLCLKDMIVEMPEEIERIFSDYKMNLVQIRDSGQYSFQNDDVRDLFEISRTIYEKDFKKLNKNYSNRTVNGEMLQLVSKITGSSQLETLSKEEKDKVEGSKMCRALEELVEEGREEGRLEGERKLKKLIIELSKAGRTEDIVRAATDDAYQDQLFEEFGIK